MVSDGGDLIVKSFIEETRFQSEIYYNIMFRNMGYKTSKIIDIDYDKKEITFEKIMGESILNSELSISKAFDTMRTIASVTFDMGKTDEIKDYYCDTVIKSISLLDSRLLHSAKFLRYMKMLREEFHTSIFKDCKPDNFIYYSGEIYLIDFDYVRISFFLADLAQFFSYFMLDRTICVDFWIKKFLKNNKSINDGSCDKYVLLTYLSIINSNILSITKNPNIEKDIVTKKEKLCHEILRDNLRLI